MPEEGITYVDKGHLLSYEELIRASSLLVSQGVNKVRITGGEPFLRKDLMDFIRSLSTLKGLTSWHITTNGVLTAPYLEELKSLGIASINLSLDTLDSERFFKITRRDQFQKVHECLTTMLSLGIRTKINMVVMNGINTDDIISMIELGRHQPIQIRFLEEMPFNGSGESQLNDHWTYIDIIKHIENHYGKLTPVIPEPNATATVYKVPGHMGNIGIIASFSRTFCGTCNRLRLTPTGLIKTCLYDDGIFNIRDLMRVGASDEEILIAVTQAIGNRAKDGFEAEAARLPIGESMATIGG